MNIIYTSLLFLFSINTLFATGPQEQVGAGIENKNLDKGICWFSSVVQALRASPQFREICANEAQKNNKVMRELHAFIQKVDSGQKIEQKEALKVVSFMMKKAKEKGYKLQGDPYNFTKFLLKKSRMMPLPFNREITITSNISGFEEVKMRPDTASHALEFTLKATTEPQELKTLIAKKQDMSLRGVNVPETLLNLLTKSNDIIGLKKMPKIDERSKMHYSETIDYSLEMGNMPPLVTIFLKRVGDKKIGLIDYFSNQISPSEELAFPIKDAGSKKAIYKLVSIVSIRLHSNISGRFIGHAYTYITPSLKESAVWTQYNDRKVSTLPSPLGKKKNAKSHFTPYEDVCKHGGIFFYEFVSCR